MYAIKIQANETYFYEADNIVKRELKFKDQAGVQTELERVRVIFKAGDVKVINTTERGLCLTLADGGGIATVIELVLRGKDTLTLWVCMPAKIFIMQDGKTIEVI